MTRTSIFVCLLGLGCGALKAPALPGNTNADGSATDAAASDAPSDAAPVDQDGGSSADAASAADAPPERSDADGPDVSGDAHARYDGAPTVPPALPGWTFVWSDEFEQAAIDESVWNILDTPGTKGNAELQYYTPRKNDEPGANVYLEDGALVIEAREEAWNDYAYTSARLNTQLGTKQFQYGRFEARIKEPAVSGLWPAFWMMGANSATVRWPICGEIDIFEGKGRLPSWVAGSLHRGNMAGAAGDVVSTKSYMLPTGNLHDDWHVFAIEWDMQHISWFVDDNLYETVNRPTAATDPWPFDQNFYILLNLAVGGLFDGNAKPPAGMPPQRLLVDYVRVYQKP